MTKKIFTGMFTAAFISVFIATVITAVFLRLGLDTQDFDELRTRAELIARETEFSGTDHLSSEDFGELGAALVSAEGELLFGSDNLISDDRSELAEAARDGSGSSEEREVIRNRLTMRYAKKLSDGTYIVVSEDRRLFPIGISAAVVMFLLMTAAVAAVSFTAAKLVTKSVAKPINAVDLNAPKREKLYRELAPLYKKMRKQKRKIASQMEELRKSREQFSLITESMREGLVIADRKLTILACNSGAIRLLESGETGEGRSIFSLNNSDIFRRCVQDAAGGRHSDCLIRTENGEREVIASPAKSGEIVNGIVVFIMDVTEKQQLEVMRREFTSNVSHELKTPLTTIYGISDMLSGGIVKPEDVARFGGEIKHEASRLIALINDIVALSKLDENALPNASEEVDLYELAAEVIERLSTGASEKTITLSLTGVHVIFSGNRTILDEIIYNLCDNAIKYGRPDGNCEVKVSHIPQKAIITVSDNGIGIPEEHIGRIFERFYRVDKSRSRKIKGTGLGLSIVKHGVMYHGGTVRAESTPGKGTVFTVELPINNQQQDKKEADPNT